MKKKILVLGAYGFLGSSLCPMLKKLGFGIIKHGRKKESETNFNVNDLSDVREVLKY